MEKISIINSSKLNFLIIILVLFFGSCSKEDDNNIKVSFEKSNFEVLNQSQDLSIKLNFDKEASRDAKIGLEFGGTAVEPYDYQALEELSIRKGDLGSEFIIQIKHNKDKTDSKIIEISLNLPSGYSEGKNSTTTITINKEN